MAGTSGGIGGLPPDPVFGQAVATAPSTDLQPATVGAFVPVGGAEITLPEAGTYKVTADVRAHLRGSGSNTNVFITARLFNVTDGAVVPDTETLVNQVVITTATGVGGAQTNALGTFITVASPTTLRLEAARNVTSGATIEAAIWSNPAGLTRLRYQKIGGG